VSRRTPRHPRAVPFAVASAAASLALAACSATAPVATSPSVATSSTRTTYPLTITQCGRSLTFDKAPQKVVVDGERYAVPLFEIGAGDRVSALFTRSSGALTPDVDVPTEVASRLHALPLLVGTAASSYPTKEAILAAAPDLVVEAYNGDAGNGDPKATDALGALGIQVFTLSPRCPGASLEQSLRDIVTLGRILDLEQPAQTLAASWKQRIVAAGAAAAAAGPGTPSTFFLDSISEKGEIWSNTGAFARDLVQAGGGRLVPAAADPSDIYTVSKEAVVTSNPDLVLTYNSGGSEDAPQKVLPLWPLVAGSPAERSRAFTVVPYPDGAGTVEFVERVSRAVAAYKSSQS
jgi:iron complex transport system substrate-binding protein